MTSLTELFANPVIRRLSAVVLALILMVVLVRLINRLLARTISDADTRYRSRKFVTFFGYLAGLLLIVAIGSGKLGAFGLTVGVIGAAIAFSLQEVISSVAGWLAISFGNLFRVGDRVQLAGTRGDVIDVGVIRTTLMEVGEWVQGDLYDGRIVRIANAFVFKQPVFNYSGDFPFLWDELRVPIRGDSDHRLARTIIERVVHQTVGEYTKTAKTSWEAMVRKYRIEDAQVEPLITLGFDENWITFTARYVVDYRRRRTVKDAIFTGLLNEIEATKGRVQVAIAAYEIAHASVDVRMEPR